MFITLHCGGMAFNGATIRHKSLGGSESAAYYVARDLAARGHRVTLFTNHQEPGEWEGVRYQWAGNASESTPLGDRFHFYASNTPTDLLIIQRHPDAFRFPWAAKVKLLWMHDLALLRNKGRFSAGFWNCDGVLAVSEYHKQQICSVYGADPKHVHVLRNGVDLELFRRVEVAKPSDDKIRLLYSSRPERGLENIVRPGGLAERLRKLSDRFVIQACCYENVTAHMRDYYQALEAQAASLPNVELLGHLTKGQLAEQLFQADALLYPTAFEEVSCITAMEAAAAGLPFLSSAVAALPETCEGAGAILHELKGGKPDLDAFTHTLNELFLTQDGRLPGLMKAQQEKAPTYAWKGRGAELERLFHEIARLQHRPETVARHLMRHSDIYALRHFLARPEIQLNVSPVMEATRRELRECYGFMLNEGSPDWSQHYADYYEYEEEKGIEYGPESLDKRPRFETVAARLADLPDGALVLDYGCAHGHYTINLAKRYPKLTFVGVDVSKSGIRKAREWAKGDEIPNAQFYLASAERGDLSRVLRPGSFSCIIAAEVLEHVESPARTVDTLAGYLAKEGLFLLTTPYGPWEGNGFRKEWPWRAHVHHLERQDLAELFGHHPGYSVLCVPETHTLGSYVTSFGHPTEPSGKVDYDRKLRQLVPAKQSLTVTMIAKNAAPSILQALQSVQDLADEIIVGVDKSTTDTTREVVRSFAEAGHYVYPAVKLLEIEPVQFTGFDEARNTVIERASCDWVMWIDADEQWSYPERLENYLQHNQFTGYAVRQHHISAEPLGVMKTDFPVRLFRNGQGVRFFGRVHEHPETEMNKGLGHVSMIPDADLMHSGYTNETVRRARFWRNIHLMVRDREDYPERTLGKFLWLRDLCQMCQYELERNGGRMTKDILNRAEDGIAIFEELLEGEEELRYVMEGLSYYSPLVKLLGEGFEAAFDVSTAVLPGEQVKPEQLQPRVAQFRSREHLERVMHRLVQQKTADVGNRYL